jgi:ATP-binding cassette subfamily B protein
MLARHRQAIVAIERLARFFPDREPTRVVEHRPVYIRTPPPKRDEARPHLPPFERLDADGVTVRHPTSGRGVIDAGLTVRSGSFTVVTGSVGSGKTTLLRGLLGLVESDNGVVRWNGEVVPVLSTFLVPPRVSYAGQTARLLSATLWENLVLGWPVDEGDVDDTLRIAALDDDVEEFPDGLQTLVGARGVRLSGGQLQRATAARALVPRPQLVVLDDLSSALDIETEQRLWERVAAGGFTCLAVSHRRAALERADEVVVLQNGRVVGDGSLPHLLRTCGEMRRLWREELFIEAEEA